jgi:hypothetical protein
MVKTRYGKTTKGQNMEVFVAGECAYTLKTTYADFVSSLSSLSDGEIGIFTEAGAVKTTALSAGEKFFVAQKVSSSNGSASVKKSNIFVYPTSGVIDNSVAGYPYATPVKPVAYVGFNGTSGSLNAPAIAINQDYQVTLLNTTPPVSAPLDALQASRTTASTTETIYSILGDPQTGIVPQINGNQTLKSFFAGIQNSPSPYVADIVSNGTYTAVTTTASHGFTNNSKNVVAGGANNVVAGDIIRVGTNAGTTVIYKVVTVGTSAFSGATANDYALDRPFTGTTGTITVFRNTVAPTEYGIKITTVDYFTTFRITLSSTSFTNATITYSTNWSLGVGTPEETVEEEYEGNNFHASSTTPNIAFASDYGQPKAYANLSRAYATIKVKNTPSERSVAAPVNEYSKEVYLIVKAPYGSATFTIGGTAQTNGFSAISNPQTGLSTAGTNTPVVSLATVLGASNVN